MYFVEAQPSLYDFKSQTRRRPTLAGVSEEQHPEKFLKTIIDISREIQNAV